MCSQGHFPGSPELKEEHIYLLFHAVVLTTVAHLVLSGARISRGQGVKDIGLFSAPSMATLVLHMAGQRV